MFALLTFINSVLGTFSICVLLWLLIIYKPSFTQISQFVFKKSPTKKKPQMKTTTCSPQSEKFREMVAKGTVHDLLKCMPPSIPKFTTIPDKGLPSSQILSILQEAAELEEKKWKNGQVSGCVYSSDLEHNHLLGTAISMFTVANPLHADVFICTRRMEAEVVKMTAAMLGADSVQSVCGFMTSGGTESILMATKTYRDMAISRGLDPDEIEILASATAHAAYFKAAHLMRIKLKKIGLRSDMSIDVDQIRASINKNTIFVVASAPAYPHGVVDDVTAIGKICSEHNVGLHVDACLGGFILPWARRAGFNIPQFDFTVQGVTSISCDTHKYGYAPKGTSILLFNTPELRSFAFFTEPDWPGGLYATPTLPGSRPGSLSVGAWAALIHRGADGYTKTAKAILDTAHVIIEGFKKNPEIRIIGDPSKLTFLVPFTTVNVNIFQVAEALSKNDWNVNVLHSPNCVHLCLTEIHINLGEQFVQCVNNCINAVIANPEKYNEKAPLYSSAQVLGDKNIVGSMLGDIIGGLLDTV